MNSSRTRNTVLNVVTSIGGQLLVTVLKFVTRTVFIHTLGKSYLGINGLFSEILTMLSLTELGIDTAINFKLYKPLAEGDDKRVRVLMKFYKQAYRVIGMTILVLGLCLIPLLPRLIRDYDTLGALGIDAALIFVIYLMQSVSSYLFFAYRSAVMKANQKTYVLDIADYVVNLATNIVQILVLVFLKNFILYTVTIIVFNILKNLVNAVIATRYYPQFFIKEPDSLSREEIIGLIKDCGALFVYKLNNVVVKATDNTVISTFLGLTMVGLYSNYLLFYTTIKSLLDRLFTAAKASTGNLFATGTIEKKYRFFQVMNFLSAILFGTAGVGVAVCADEIIKVWVGRDYLIAPPFAVLVGIEVLFHGMKVNLGQVRNVTGIFRQMWFRPVLGVIVNLGVSIWLVNVCGIYGVIIGTITADILTNFLVDPSVIHKYSFENRWPVSEYYRKNVVYLALIAIICAVDMLICRHFFVGHGWFSVIVHVVIVAVSVPGVFALIYWRSGECRYLVGILNRIIVKVFRRGRQAI